MSSKERKEALEELKRERTRKKHELEQLNRLRKYGVEMDDTPEVEAKKRADYWRKYAREKMREIRDARRKEKIGDQIRCSRCGFEPKNWSRVIGVCASCGAVSLDATRSKPDGAFDDLFVYTDRNAILDHHKFVEWRLWLGVSAGRYAKVAGWTRRRQVYLEHGKAGVEMQRATVERLKQAFEHFVNLREQ